MSEALRDAQLEMARHLRNPGRHSAPAGIEERRLAVYRSLIFNNVEGFLSGGFPVLRSLYNQSDWEDLVRAFLDFHRCQSPYFLEISQEFIAFLTRQFERRACDPAFIVELAHYEWVELALDVAEDCPPGPPASLDPLVTELQLSPLAWVLSYNYPVHRIGPGYEPEESAQPTFLVVYRDREESVCFMELNAATARLLELVRDGQGRPGAQLLEQLAVELGADPAAIAAFGSEQLIQFASRGIIEMKEAGHR